MIRSRSFYGTVKEKAVTQGKKTYRKPFSGLRIGVVDVVVRLSVVHAP